MSASSQWNQQTVSFPAGGAILAHHFVKFDSNRAIVPCAATTDIPIGVSRDAAATGETVAVIVGGLGLLTVSAAVALGALVGTTADAEGVTLTPGAAATAYVAARAFEAATADQDDILVQVVPATNIALSA